MAEIIVALISPAVPRRSTLLDRLPEARWVKVGSILMTREGPPSIRELIGRGLRVFLDLKWHDIPNTVADAVVAARDAGVSMATVHSLGGEAMMAAAARAADGGLALVGVTVLTSHVGRRLRRGGGTLEPSSSAPRCPGWRDRRHRPGFKASSARPRR